MKSIINFFKNLFSKEEETTKLACGCEGSCEGHIEQCPADECVVEEPVKEEAPVSDWVSSLSQENEVLEEPVVEAPKVEKPKAVKKKPAPKKKEIAVAKDSKPAKNNKKKGA